MEIAHREFTMVLIGSESRKQNKTILLLKFKYSAIMAPTCLHLAYQPSDKMGVGINSFSYFSIKTYML